ncbi:TetR/AcrR family transcriptional regulator [Vitiosangium sp. GDMCC 1.1324]|uniref:TetR/AcrR family transcriptional regulator n=1 Tax=Vitiosangium sp. (strain GDMCC 1.1324) TaxID=2138576 RepID=UPI000D3B6BE1|nr:TetR/AcrR family transcriptional regulator [Vitiosangium sp. GDMCC 1.1324]PTL75710.1 TetR family transcriptional regulator [Vitiosangium sp. GDMCC 1.1324]
MSAPTTVELLWGTQQRPKRGPKPSLSLSRIVAEAISLADTEGLANLSMQRLAERLGCAKMAPYRYVPGKAELTALMLDTAMGAPPELTVAKANSTEEPWRAQLRRWAVTIFDRYRAHPWTLELAVGARPFGPNEMGWLEAALGALSGTGLTGAERLDTVVLLNGHVRSLAQQATAGGGDDLEQQLTRQLAEVLATHGDRYREVTAAFADSAAASGRDNALHFGIDRILDGLAALVARRARRPAPAR